MTRRRRHRSSSWLAAALRVFGILFVFGIATVAAGDVVAADDVELVEPVEASEDFALVDAQHCPAPHAEACAPARDLIALAHQPPVIRPPVPPPR